MTPGEKYNFTLFSAFFPTFTEGKRYKNIKNAEKHYFKKRTVGKAPACWSKYITQGIFKVDFFSKVLHLLTNNVLKFVLFFARTLLTYPGSQLTWPWNEML